MSNFVLHIEEGKGPPRIELPRRDVALIVVPVAGVPGAPFVLRSAMDVPRDLGTGEPGSFGARAAGAFFGGGGRECLVVPVAGRSDSALSAGIAAAAGLSFGLMLVPDAAGNVPLLALAAAVAAEAGALLIADPPTGCDPAAWLAFATDPRWTNRADVAAYAPWLKARDGMLVPPSGAVAAAITTSERERGLWRAPANIAVDGMPACPFVEAEWRPLVEAGLNPLRSLRGATRIWGARTLAAADCDLGTRYLNVRRLSQAIAEGVQQGGGWVVFEPNDEPLWAALRGQVENFLHGLWRAGAFAGPTEAEGYFVRCDRTTMTQADIDAGRVVILIGFAPLKPAEFVVLRIGLWSADAA